MHDVEKLLRKVFESYETLIGKKKFPEWCNDYLKRNFDKSLKDSTIKNGTYGFLYQISSTYVLSIVITKEGLKDTFLLFVTDNLESLKSNLKQVQQIGF